LLGWTVAIKAQSRPWSEKSTLEAELALQIRASKLPAPTREYRFHPTRKWQFDFAFPEQKVAVEVQGAIWTNGRHNRGKGMESDYEKGAEAMLMGWKVLWITASTIRSGRAIQYLERLLKVD
jgi:very-short-patch-repair endonuclease